MTTEPEQPTEAASTEPIPAVDAEHLERIARLQARRAGSVSSSPAPDRRRHPAMNGRVAATALGVSAVFGLVTAYGVAAHDAGPELADVEPAGRSDPEPIVIEVRLVDADGNPVASAPPTGSGPSEVIASRPEPTATAEPVATAAPAPRVRVLTAPAAPAPAAAPAPVVEATTNGSR